MNIALLSIGNELLSGDTLNTNAAWIGRKVTEFGCSVQQQITVPDDGLSIIDGLGFNNNELVNVVVFIESI